MLKQQAYWKQHCHNVIRMKYPTAKSSSHSISHLILYSLLFCLSLSQVESYGGQNRATGKSPHSWFMFASPSPMYLLLHRECNNKHHKSAQHCLKPQRILRTKPCFQLPPTVSLSLYCFVLSWLVKWMLLLLSHAIGKQNYAEEGGQTRSRLQRGSQIFFNESSEII